MNDMYHPNLKRSLIPLYFLSLVLLLAVLFIHPSNAGAAEPSGTAFPIPPLSDNRDPQLPNVVVIATGGTLAGKARDATSFQTYQAGTYLMSDLVNQLPNKNKIANVNTYQFGNKGSGSYSMGDLYDLSLAVDQALEVYDGVVVTTGTDTMEEIAYFLDLTVRSEKPVVVTGAMRPWDVIGTDGPANLYNAIKLAGSGKTKSFGTVVMLNDIIQAARDVTKTNAQRMDTFETPILGALGYIDETNIRIYRTTAKRFKAGRADWATPFDLKKITKDKLPAVEIVYGYQDSSAGAIKGFVAEGAKGIVTAGTGAGGISSKMSTARSNAIKQGVIFVTTTRTGSGTMYPSGGNGIIAGDSLNPQHARIMLLLSMAFSNDFNTIKNWFGTVGTQAIQLKTQAPDIEAPVWPQGSALQVTNIGQNSLTLTWPEASDDIGVKQYRIYETGSGTVVGNVYASVTNGVYASVTNSVYSSVTGSVYYSFNLSTLTAGTTYTFSVTAVDAAGNESIGLSKTIQTNSPRSSSDSTGSSNSGSGSPVVPAKLDVTVPAGGTRSVSWKDAIWITIPEGATSQELHLTAESLQNVDGLVSDSHKLLSSVFEILKNFTQNFGKPVSISFLFDPAKLGQDQQPSVFYYDETKKTWIEIGGTVMDNKITVEVNHFTKFAVFAVDKPKSPGSVEISFSDIAGHWAELDIKQAVTQKIISGYADGTFKPDNSVTRAEFAVMLMNALKVDKKGNALMFADQQQIPAWAETAVTQAVDLGIIHGYEDQTFRPDGLISRAEMAVMISAALGTTPATQAATSFADDEEIPAWAKGHVESTRALGIIDGRSGNKFEPADTATRAEAVKVLMKMMQRK
ncbi:asparaginase domain-containing protein [Paenibacillus anseongense]|uniref:asparaginase domain-containing protein n=1 Tax=Paenibacillus anseongense TaxID=2682845 RepID=UPI002DBBD68F|nr:asparaginase domain-containing protein [Paenibacillus anseongense]MEC0268165.1 asparaginase domain-containing protein [Paenibacillus anseongense]